MGTENKKRRANIYMDSTGIYYIIKSKKENIKGKVLFELEHSEVLTYSDRLRKLRSEIKQMKKRNKIKEFNLLLTEGIRMVKVLKFNREVQLNSDVDLILKEELTKYLQPSESINDFDIKYLKTGKKTQDTFLTALIQRKPVIELCTYAIQDNINLVKILIPEICMYETIRDLNGLNIVVLYNEGMYEMRTLVCKGSEFLFASQIGTLSKEDVEYEVQKLEEHIKNQYNMLVSTITVIGLDIVTDSTYEPNSLKTELEPVVEDIEKRYSLLMNI